MTIWVDASSGASGDMLLGALHDLGVPAAVMADAARAVAPVRIDFGSEVRHGFAVARAEVRGAEVRGAEVRGAEDDVPHRTWADVRSMLDEAALDRAVRERAHAAFARLAEAEGKVHGTSADAVHFHEVGAHDAIGDIVGVCAGFAWLAEDVVVGPIALGGGTARSAHGAIPVPGPAVLQLLSGTGAACYGGPVDVELCTPTGAALLTTWATSYGPMPVMTVEAVGQGAGSRVLPQRLGALRLVRGTPCATTDPVSREAAVVLESNVDDLDPRVWPVVLQRLLDAGASDAWLTPIVMKKGRPAHTLHVLCPATSAERLQRLVLTETSAIGLRTLTVGKIALARTETTVDVGGQPVRVKVAELDGRVVNAMPEHDDVVAAAQALGQPLKVVLARAAAAASALLT